LKQLNHYNTNFKKRSFSIILICDNIINAANIGSIFRTADAFGIEKVFFCGEDISLGRKMTKTSRASEKNVNYEIIDSVEEVVKILKEQDYQIISLEITSESEPIHTYSFSKEIRIALVIGDENFGVSETILNNSDAVLHIEMFGQNSSMNVVQATTIAFYEITKQHL